MKNFSESLNLKIFMKNLTLLLLLFIFYENSFANDIDASAAVVVDGQTGKILYGKNPHLKLPPASTTKLVAAMVAFERLSPEKRITISENASKTPSVSPKLRVGEVYTVHDLIYLALMRSVNSATVALAEAAAGSEEDFVELMNDKANKIGAKDTKFANASGLPGKEQYTTAYNLTKIISHALSYPLIREAMQARVYIVHSEDGKEQFILNTNQLLWTEDNMIGGKTGYTRSAGHCFVSAAWINNRLVYTAILGASNRDKLWKDTEILLSRAEDVLSGKNEPIVQFTQEKPIIKTSFKKAKASERKKQVLQKKKKISNKKDIKTKKITNKKFNQKRKGNAKINSKSI